MFSSPQLLDLASGFSTNVPSSSHDPWSDNFISSNNINNPNHDPWGGAPITSTTTTTKQQIIDPWAPSTTNTNTNTNDLWTTNIKPTQTQQQQQPITTTNPWSSTATTTNDIIIADPWAPAIPPSAPQMTLPRIQPAMTSTKKADENDFDDFEMFSNKRVTSPSTVNPTANNASDLFGDFFGNSSSTATPSNTNPWNDNNNNENSSKANNIEISKLNPIRKTPESFLGENSSLVNLENLIPTSGLAGLASSNNNNNNNRPKSTNPFGNLQQQLNNTLQQSTSANNLLNRPMSTTTTTTSAAVSNPFAQQLPKAPPMNQLNGNSANLFPSFPATSTGLPFMQSQQSPIIMPQMQSTATPFPAFNQQQQQFMQNQSTVAAFGGYNQQSTNPFL